MPILNPAGSGAGTPAARAEFAAGVARLRAAPRQSPPGCWRSAPIPIARAAGCACGEGGAARSSKAAGCAASAAPGRWARAAVARELQGQAPRAALHRHRVPLGSAVALPGGDYPRAAARGADPAEESQADGWAAGSKREHGLQERAITRALGVQWGCPVLTIENHSPERVAGAGAAAFHRCLWLSAAAPCGLAPLDWWGF